LKDALLIRMDISTMPVLIFTFGSDSRSAIYITTISYLALHPKIKT
jgi:hypothetical protein